VSRDPDSLLVVAGEASGDLHGARLLSELARLRPELAAFGLGGDEMRRAGLDAVAHSAEISVVGIAEVWKILPRAREIFATLLAEVERRQPALAVLIDFPEFNLRLARRLAERGVKVVYYISPQIWAWRRGRVRTIAKVVERMLVLFPFEVDFYRQSGVDVVHVGHPLIDEVPVLPQIWDQVWDREGGPPFRIALLPGSRRSEVAAHLEVMLAAVRLLGEQLPLEVLLIQAPNLPSELFAAAIAKAGVRVQRVVEDRFAAIAGSHLALCASGTATLEVGLLGTPLLVIYRLKRSTYWLARLLVRLPSVSLVNLVLGHLVVPELLQGDANPEEIARQAARWLTDPGAIAEMRQGLSELRSRLGAGGASGRAAREVAALLPSRKDAVA
jgi:lipid-A-disaccharide synthase